MDGLCTIARVLGTALALGLTAAAPAATLPISGGFMTVSASDPSGAWLFADGNQLTAFGNFNTGGFEWPVNYVGSAGPFTFGSAIPMSWFSDSVDGWQGRMSLGGNFYYLTGSTVNESSWSLTAAPILIGHAGTYQEAFSFSGSLCGFSTPSPVISCAAHTNFVGAGTLDLTVAKDPGGPPGSFDIESVSYTFHNVPEPASLGLLVAGLVGLGLRRSLAPC